MGDYNRERLGGMAPFMGVVREGFSEDVTFERMRVHQLYMSLSRKSVSGRGKSQCKGPEAGACLAAGGEAERLVWLEQSD